MVLVSFAYAHYMGVVVFSYWKTNSCFAEPALTQLSDTHRILT